MRIDFDTQYRVLSDYVVDDRWLGDHTSYDELVRISPDATGHGDGEVRALRSDFTLHFAATTKTEITVNVPLVRLDIKWETDDEHHRNETVEGIGDLRVSVKRFLKTGPKGQQAVFGGLSLPIASRTHIDRLSFIEHEEAEELGVEVPHHTHQQIGTGTYDPFIGWEGVWLFEQDWLWFARFEATIPWDETSDGLRGGVTTLVSTGPALLFPEKKIVLGFPWRFIYQEREQLSSPDILTPSGIVLDGSILVPNTGRFDAIFAPTVSWSVGEHWSFRASVEVPVYTRIHHSDDDSQVQFVDAFGLLFGVSWAK